MRSRLFRLLGLQPMAHRPPLVWRFWVYAATAYLMPVVVQVAFPMDASSMDELVWLVTLAPAFILSLHYGLRGAFVALLLGTALFVAVQLSLALYHTTDDPRVTVPIYIAYGTLAISVGWLSEQLHEHYELALELQAKQKTDGLAQLAAALGHDFNNILTTMVAGAEIIADRVSPETPEEPVELVHLRAAARRGAGIVRNLLGLSRRGILNLTPLDLCDLFGDLAPRLEQLVPDTVATSVECAPGLPSVLADARAVEEIVTNLVTNARDAMPAGGELRIEADLERLSREQFERRGWGEPGEYVCLSVADSGDGMAEDIRQRVFDPFFTTKEPDEGIGLGLSVVYGLVKQHRGFVIVDSAPGEGTTVRVYLRPTSVRKETAVPEDRGTARTGEPDAGVGEPVPATAGPADSPSGRPDAPDRPRTILVVEDDASIRHAAGRILERAGYAVVVAVDGSEALSILRSERDAIALVLCDVLLPELTGPEVYRRVRGDPATPPFLFTSGYPADNLVEGVSLDSGLPFLPKPWTVAELTGAVGEVLDEA